MTATRRLAAILAADVAGYSRLIGADEAGTLQALKAIRAELIDPTIAAHDGRLAVVSKKVVQSIRQGFLLEQVWPQRRAAARTLRAGCRRSPLAILAPTRRYGRWWTQVGTKQRSLRSNQATGI
jgi:class 3 adenylate cyclase